MPGYHKKKKILPLIPDYAKQTVTARRGQGDSKGPLFKKAFTVVVPQESLPPIYPVPPPPRPDTDAAGDEDEESAPRPPPQPRQSNGFNALQGSLNNLLLEMEEGRLPVNPDALAAPASPRDAGGAHSKTLDERWMTVSRYLNTVQQSKKAAPGVVRRVRSLLSPHPPEGGKRPPPQSAVPEVLTALDVFVGAAALALPPLAAVAAQLRAAVHAALRLPAPSPERRPAAQVVADAEPTLRAYRALEEDTLLHRTRVAGAVGAFEACEVGRQAVVAAPAGPGVGRALQRWQRQYLVWVFEKWREVVKFTKTLRRVGAERDGLRQRVRELEQYIEEREAAAQQPPPPQPAQGSVLTQAAQAAGRQWDSVWKLKERESAMTEMKGELEVCRMKLEEAEAGRAADKRLLEAEVAALREQEAGLRKRWDETDRLVRCAVDVPKPREALRAVHRVAFDVLRDGADGADGAGLRSLMACDSLMHAVYPSFAAERAAEAGRAASLRSAETAGSSPVKKQATFVFDKRGIDAVFGGGSGSGAGGDEKPGEEDEAAMSMPGSVVESRHSSLATDAGPTQGQGGGSGAGEEPGLQMPQLFGLSVGVDPQELYDMLYDASEAETGEASMETELYRSVVLCMSLHSVLAHDLGEQTAQLQISSMRGIAQKDKKKQEEKYCVDMVNAVSAAMRHQHDRTRACIKLVQTLLWGAAVRLHRKDVRHRRQTLLAQQEEDDAIRELLAQDAEKALCAKAVNEAVDRFTDRNVLEAAEEKKLREVLFRSQQSIIGIYRYYASSDFRAMDTLLSKEELDLFLSDCGIVKQERRGSASAFGGRRSVSQSMRRQTLVKDAPAEAPPLHPADFVEKLLTLAVQRHKADKGGAHEWMASFLEGCVLPNAYSVCPSSFREHVGTKECSSCFAQFKPQLMALYTKHCHGNKQGLDWKGFKDMMVAQQVPDDTVSHYALQQIFVKMKTTPCAAADLHKTYAEFLVDLGAVATYKTPAPYLPLHVRLRAFLLKLLEASPK